MFYNGWIMIEDPSQMQDLFFYITLFHRKCASTHNVIILMAHSAPMVVVYHPQYATHIQYRYHPESPFRMEYIIKKVTSLGLKQEIIEPEAASEGDILAVHRPTYLEKIRSSTMKYLDGETVIREDTYDVAMLAAGGAVTAVNETYLRNRPSFAIVRPPGHHAGPDYGGGFCYFNNSAIAARKALKMSSRVAIVDIDAHHGNGTQDIFYETSKVLYISTHQFGIYPGTGRYNEAGRGDGEGYNINIPLPARSGDSTYLYAFENLVMPVLKEFNPDAIIVSLGVDAHYRDDMSGLELSSTGYLELAALLQDFSEKYMKNRLVYVLEGGYNGVPLSEVVAGIIGRFEGKKVHLQYGDIRDESIKGKEYVDRSRNFFSQYWKL